MIDLFTLLAENIKERLFKGIIKCLSFEFSFYESYSSFIKRTFKTQTLFYTFKKPDLKKSIYLIVSFINRVVKDTLFKILYQFIKLLLSLFWPPFETHPLKILPLILNIPLSKKNTNLIWHSFKIFYTNNIISKYKFPIDIDHTTL